MLRKNSLDDIKKLNKYLNGEYSMPAPPVCTALWTNRDWIKFIDIEGTWHSDRHSVVEDNKI